MPVDHIRPQRVDVYFDSQGHLDPRHHPGPQTFEMVVENKQTVTLRIGMTGQVEDVTKSKHDPSKDKDANDGDGSAAKTTTGRQRRPRRSRQ